MDDIAISVKNVSKTFKLPHEKNTSLKSAIIHPFKKRSYEKQQVLKNISFDIKKGEFFGIVGRNGSGKSTLLKLLAGIYTPTEGAIHINGKLTPFIELGVGFSPELTGRENVFLNGSLLGFNRKQMDAMYDEIVAFAELKDHMDVKLKNFSSGMQVRLAFSIAIQAKTDILVLDEVLAVGDAAFQQKCYDYFEDLKRNKKTVVLVTHDMGAMERFCTRAVLIENGEVVKQGDVHKVSREYAKLFYVPETEVTDNQKDKDKTELKKETNRVVSRIFDENMSSKTRFNVGDKISVGITWTDIDTSKMESVGINIFKSTGEHITGINSRTGNLEANWREKGQLILDFNLNLRPGQYYIVSEAFDMKGRVIDSHIDGPKFTINDMKMTWSGLTQLEHNWRNFTK